MKVIKKENLSKAINTIHQFQYKNDPETCRNILLSISDDMSDQIEVDALGNKYAVITEKKDRTFDPYIGQNVDVSYLHMLYGYCLAKQTEKERENTILCEI